MGLVRGVDLSVIEEHLALVFLQAVNPDRNIHGFERVLKHGRATAHRLMQPMYETYGNCNYDGDTFNAFGRSDIAKLETEIIAHATTHSTTILSDCELPR
jgi:hypothetical protein